MTENIYAFSIRQSDPFASRKIVIFCPPQTADAGEVGRALRAAQDERDTETSALSSVLVVGSALDAEFLRRLPSEAEFAEQMARDGNNPPPARIQVVQYSWSGDFDILLDGTTLPSDGTNKMDGPQRAEVLNEGIARIVSTHPHVVGRAPGFHYAKPSGKHSDVFIRACEALTHGPEIMFIAIGLLPHLGISVRRISCDTASISPLAYAAIQIRNMLNPDLPYPYVSSFGSYGGLRSIAPDGGETLYLISATTSGDLPYRILKRKVHAEQIITVFALSQGKPAGTVLHDLTAPAANRKQKFAPGANRKATECDLCHGGSIAINIEGDSFIPEPPDTKLLVIESMDSSRLLRRFIKELVGAKALRAYYPIISEGLIREQYVDITRALDSRRYKRRVQNYLCQIVPQRLRRIAYLDDSGSKALAQLLRKQFNGARPQICKARDIQQTLKEGTTVVVAAAASSGNELTKVDRDLRSKQTNGSVWFVAGLLCCPTEESEKRLRSNLTYGHFETNWHHRLMEIDKLFLPSPLPQPESAWDSEKLLLQRVLQETKFPEGSPAKKFIDDRLNQLRSASGDEVRGLADDIFLCGMNGSPLKLNEGFALWDRKKGTEQNHSPAQGDVFFTVAVVLHGLRNTAGARRLENHQHRRVVLDPENFNRFSDAIVQAAILRAAQPAEMNYASNDAVSRKMKDVIIAEIQRGPTDRGDSVAEFLLALACQRMTVQAPHLKMIVRAIEQAIKHKVIPDQSIQAILSECIHVRATNRV